MDEFWSDFLRHTEKTDVRAIAEYFDQLRSHQPALTDMDLCYAITLVSKWVEKGNAPPNEKVQIAILCGQLWPESDPEQPYMPAFFYEWACQISEENGLEDLASEAQAEIINFYKHRYLIDKSLPFVIALEKSLDNPKIRSRLTKLHFKYHTLAQYYYRLNKYDLSIKYNQKALEAPDANYSAADRLNMMNTIALSYNSLGNYKEAIRCYDEVIQTAIKIGNRDWEYIAKGNKGMVMLELGKLEEAERLLEEDFNGNLFSGQVGSALNACITLASLKLKNKDLVNAQKYLKIADSIEDTLGASSKTILTWSEYYSLLGDWERAYKYRSRAAEMLDSINRKTTTLEIFRTREQHSLLQQKALLDQKLLEQKNARKADKQYFLIAFSLLVLALAVFGMFFYMKQQKQKIVQRHLQERLAESKRELERYVRRVQHHNELSQGIEEHLSRVLPDKEQDKIRDLLLQFTFSTDDDWKQFKRLFDEVHHDFIRRLHEQESLSFTPGEIRMLVLLKLEFSNREIAQTLGISLEGVKKNKQRLRKKLQPTTDTELLSLLNH